MKLSQFYNLLRKYIRQNIPIVIFVGIVAFVGIVVLFRLFTATEDTVYAKVKVSQGLWWASTAKPSVWLAESLKPGMVETSLSGKPIVEIQSVRYYPWWNSEQYDVYLELKIKVSKNERTNKMTFKRAPLAVGAPIDLEFPEVEVSGTVMDISDNPIDDKRIDKVITLEKKYANQWEVDALQIGDTYFDGKEVTLEVLDKTIVQAPQVLIRIGSNYPYQAENTYNMTVTAKINAIETPTGFLYREDHPIQLGRVLNAQTDHFFFQDYTITAIEK